MLGRLASLNFALWAAWALAQNAPPAQCPGAYASAINDTTISSQPFSIYVADTENTALLDRPLQFRKSNVSGDYNVVIDETSPVVRSRMINGSLTIPGATHGAGMSMALDLSVNNSTTFWGKVIMRETYETPPSEVDWNWYFNNAAIYELLDPAIPIYSLTHKVYDGWFNLFQMCRENGYWQLYFVGTEGETIPNCETVEVQMSFYAAINNGTCFMAPESDNEPLPANGTITPPPPK